MTTITEEATEAVAIKSLEWERSTNKDDGESEEASTPFGGYVITADPFSYSPTTAYYVDGPNWFKGQFKSPLEAKAAAQADYEARIRSALVAPQAEGRDTAAVRDVLAERERQKTAEGWTPEHDDGHDSGQLARAAACYAMAAGESNASYRRTLTQRMELYSNRAVDTFKALWPWGIEWWKPTTPRRDLVKAGALILAEIERLDRALSPKEQE